MLEKLCQILPGARTLYAVPIRQGYICSKQYKDCQFADMINSGILRQPTVFCKKKGDYNLQTDNTKG